MQRHLLVTNDFPPKLGGIQQYLWELWRRLDPQSFEVHTTPYAGTVEFDAEQAYRIVRSREPFLIPYPWLARRINTAASDFGATLSVLDPAIPLGSIGPALDHPYAVVLHGAEVTIPGRLPVSRQLLARTLRGASGVISAGQYALDEAERAAGIELPSVVVPPGVDTDRYRPISDDARRDIRIKYGIPVDAPCILSVSRLVPRKGMDTLIAAAGRLQRRHPDLQVVIAGSGRDTKRLQHRIDSLGAPVRLLGRIPEADKPALYGAADLFAMLCRNRWGGLEQEGFGIVFVEAAAAGVPQVAGKSGGSAEAVEGDVTGAIVDTDGPLGDVVEVFDHLLTHDSVREAMGAASRKRAETHFAYEVLATRLSHSLNQWT